MSSAMATLEELSPDERQRNRDTAVSMIKDFWYRFDPSVETVPLEHRIGGVKGVGKSVRFSRGKYMGWREKNEEHLFLGITTNGEKMFCPIFLCGGVLCVEDTDQTDV